ncbi:MAG: DUF5011 domain-containing protein, partial [Nitrosopumilus sp.]|nr:DUF5011 domain-containing protein [Nitrosopumilus sp.]
ATGVPGPEDIETHVIWYSCLKSGVPQDSRTVVLFDTTGPRVELIGPERFLIGTGSTRDVPGALCHEGGKVTNATVEQMLDKDAPGEYPHRYVCTDEMENVSHANRTVVVVDDEKPPVLELRGLSEMYIQKGLDFIEPGHSCVDEVDGVLPVDVEPPDTSIGGIRSVIYTCTDFAGNGVEAERLVIVADDMDKPVLQLNGPPRVSVLLGNEYNELGAMCRDLFDGVLDVDISHAVDTNKRGVYNVTYSCEDSAGNEAVKKRAVAVAPLTAIGPDLTSGIVALPSAPASHGNSCGSTFSATITEDYRAEGLHLHHANPGIFNDATISHIEVVAPSTNKALRIFGFTPAFESNNVLIPYTVLANITADPEYEPYRITGIRQSGTVDSGSHFFRTFVSVLSHPDLTPDIVKQTAAFRHGPNSYIYMVNSDGGTMFRITGGNLVPDTTPLQNNYGTCVSGTRTAEHDPDNVDPVITAVGPRDILHKFGTEIVDPGITCTDNRDPDPKITLRILDINENPIDDLNTHTPSLNGPNFAFYTCTDASGNDVFYSREYAVVKENQDAYLITMEGPPIDSVPLGGTYVDPGAVCRNAVRGLTAPHVPESFVDTSKEGRYHIHYSCRDDLAFVLRDGSRIAGFAIRIVDVQLAPVPHVISAEPVAETCPAPIALRPGISAEDGHVMMDLGEAGLPSLISYVEVSADGGRTIAIYNYTLSDGEVSIHLHPTTAAAIAVNPQSAAYNVKAIYHTDVVGDIETARLTPVKVIADDTISPEAYGTFSSFVGRTALAFNDTTLVEPGEAPDPTVRLTGLEAKCAKAAGRAALDADPPVMVGLPDDRIIVRGTDYTMPMVECRDIIEGVFEAVPDGTVDVDTLGIYPITYTCRDSDNTVSATRTVTVIEKDDTKPVIQRRGGSVSYHVTGTIYEDPGAICTDIVDGAFNATAKIPADITGAGTHTVIYTCTDVSGNESVRNRTVITQGSLPSDAAPPALAVVPPSIMAISVNAPFTDPGITCNDETNKIIDIPQVTGEVDTRTAGQYTLQYDCVDESGNLASQNPFTPRIRTVIVTEEVVLTLNGTLDDVAEFGQPYAEPGYTCRDVDGSEITNIERVPAVLDTRITGEQVLTYTCTNAIGEEDTRTRTVDVRDTVPPAIQLHGRERVPFLQDTKYRDAGATCTDLQAGTFMVNASTDTSVPGAREITLVCRDQSGNSANATRTVIVVPAGDKTEPVITLVGPDRDSVRIGATYDDPGATCRDPLEGLLDVTSSGLGDLRSGVHLINYTCVDIVGNTDKRTRTVVPVEPDDTLTLVLRGTTIHHLNVGDTYEDPGALCTDELGREYDWEARGDDLVDTVTPAEFPVVYTCNDGARSAEPVVRTVRVVAQFTDTDPPTITVKNATIDLRVNSPYTDLPVTCEDVQSGGISLVTSVITSGGRVVQSVAVSEPGSSTITYDCTDQAGNRASEGGTYARIVNVHGMPELEWIGRPDPDVPSAFHPRDLPFDMSELAGCKGDVGTFSYFPEPWAGHDGINPVTIRCSTPLDSDSLRYVVDMQRFTMQRPLLEGRTNQEGLITVPSYILPGTDLRTLRATCHDNVTGMPVPGVQSRPPDTSRDPVIRLTFLCIGPVHNNTYEDVVNVQEREPDLVPPVILDVDGTE